MNPCGLAIAIAAKHGRRRSGSSPTASLRSVLLGAAPRPLENRTKKISFHERNHTRDGASQAVKTASVTARSSFTTSTGSHVHLKENKTAQMFFSVDSIASRYEIIGSLGEARSCLKKPGRLVRSHTGRRFVQTASSFVYFSPSAFSLDLGFLSLPYVRKFLRISETFRLA